MAKQAKEINGVPISILGSYVESVTGTLVDNTDPLNPIVDTPNLTDVLTEGNDAGTLVIENAGDATNPQDLPTYKQLLDNGYNNFFVEVVAIVNQNLTVQTVDGVAGKLNALFVAQTSAADNGFYGWNGGSWVKFPFPFYNHETEYSFLSKNIFSANFGSTVGTAYLMNAGFTNYTFNRIGLNASALIEDAINDGVTDKAPSENAVFDALALKQNKSIEVTGSLTASNDAFYINTASATYTDPSPVQAKGYRVLVRNGTATIGGVGYSDAGLIISRYYHSGAWATYVATSEKDLTADIPVDSDSIAFVDASDSNKPKRTTLAGLWNNWLNNLISTITRTVSAAWSFSADLTISGARLLFTNTTTANGDGWYRQATNVVRGSINSTDRFEMNTSGVKTKGTHTFESTLFTNLTPSAKSIAVINTDTSVSADYVAETAYQNVGYGGLAATASTASFFSVLSSATLGDRTWLTADNYTGRQMSLFSSGFLSCVNTNTYNFKVYFGPAATALASRTLVLDMGAVTSAGFTNKAVRFVGEITIRTLGASGVAVIVCSASLKVDGLTTVTKSTVTTTGVSTLVDNVLDWGLIFNASNASNAYTGHHDNVNKIS